MEHESILGGNGLLWFNLYILFDLRNGYGKYISTDKCYHR
jgi:hypothetical protein